MGQARRCAVGLERLALVWPTRSASGTPLAERVGHLGVHTTAIQAGALGSLPAFSPRANSAPTARRAVRKGSPMLDRNTGWLTALALGGCLLAPGRAGAGPLLDWCHGNDCPPGCYSCFHTLTPTLLYAYERCHHPANYSYPVDRHPDVPLGYYITRYPCPQVPPASSRLPPT